eukprot:13379751-Heterocapsa_arctica.AAC.1
MNARPHALAVLRLPDGAQLFINDVETVVAVIRELKMKPEIAELHVQLKLAGEDREKQHKEFQMT